MNRISGIVLLSIVCIFTLSACCEKKIYCGASPLDFAFVGFTQSEVRSFTIRRFIKGDQWGKAIDSAQYIYSGGGNVTGKIDTFYLENYNTISDYDGILVNYDWGIYLPATGKTFFITTIFDDNNISKLVRCGDDETSCTRSITNFSINDSWQNGNFAYLVK